MNNIEVKLNEFGFYEIISKPTEKELEEYYNEKYYQLGLGSYNLEYSQDELIHIKNKIEEKLYIVSKFISLDSTTTVLDIGCGEGWVLSYLKEKGIPATGIDYSSFGCRKFNPDSIDDFIEADIYATLDQFTKENKRYKLVWVDNVLEHVLDPYDLIIRCNNLLDDGGVLMVEVPNDFSVLQKYLLDHEYIDRQFWIAYPDHLSYFNREGLNRLAGKAGLTEVFAMADFPIDINLLNEHTNYIKDKSKGKSCYASKISFENLIHSNGIESAINLYKSFIDAGIGRCLTSFFVK
ncbi:MAG: class I SAM-dependent methyltransferase [Saprospiraceae bacterium]